jgi:hypothetical protein
MRCVIRLSPQAVRKWGDVILGSRAPIQIKAIMLRCDTAHAT